LWNWRSQAWRPAREQQPSHGFVPVKLLESTPQAAPMSAGRIEIALLPDGVCIRVGDEVSPAALRRVIAALRG
jgi:hypothetical protein